MNLSGASGPASNPGFASRFNGDYFLQAGATVFEDESADRLTGAAGNKDDDVATDIKDEVFANDLHWLMN